MKIVQRMDVACVEVTSDQVDEALSGLVGDRGMPGVIVDALFGTGLTRPIEGRLAAFVRWINERGSSGVPILSVDIPSGLDADSGEALGETIHASLTVTMVAPKIGFDALAAQSWLGDVSVVGIGTPRVLLDELGTPRAGVHHPGEGRPEGDRRPGRRGRVV